MHVILLLVCGNISKDNFILFFVFFLTFLTWDRRWAFDSLLGGTVAISGCSLSLVTLDLVIY